MPEAAAAQDVAPATSAEAAEPSSPEGGAPSEGAGGDTSVQETEQGKGKDDKSNEPPPKLARAWDRYRSDQRELSKKQKEFDGQQREWKQSVQQIQNMYAQFQRDRETFNKEREAWTKKLKDAPLEAIEEAGVKFESLTDTAIRRNTPEWRIEQMEKREQEREEALKRDKEEKTAAEKRANFESAKSEFAKWTKLNDKDYPLLSEEDAEYIGRKAAQVAPELKQKLGRIPLNEEIAKELEARLDGRYSRYHAKKQKLASPPGSQEHSERGNGAGAGPAKPSGSKPTDALTNDDATERSGSRAQRMTTEQKRIAGVADVLPDFLT